MWRGLSRTWSIWGPNREIAAVIGVARPKYKQLPINITKHAIMRFEQRISFPWEEANVQMPAYIERRLKAKALKRLKTEIRKRLKAALKIGIELDDGAIHIRLEGGYTAVCVPDIVGWTVLTILEPPGSIINEKSKSGKAV